MQSMIYYIVSVVEFYVMDETERQSQLAALFATLAEDDKDMVIAMTESLTQKYNHTTESSHQAHGSTEAAELKK